MLSQKDLLFHPSDVQPLGSVKGVLNKPTNIKINLLELFHSDDNTNLVSTSLYAIYRQNGGKCGRSKFRELIPLLMKKFSASNNLHGYETVEAQTTGVNNYVEALRAINKDFQKYCYKYFKWNIANPFNDEVEVGPSDKRTWKKPYELRPDDHMTLDLWREQFTQVLNRNFRDNNRIPVYRTSIHTRHFDRSNEGLLENNPDRASLENPVRGYDMSQIEKGIFNYKDNSWWEI